MNLNERTTRGCDLTQLSVRRSLRLVMRGCELTAYMYVWDRFRLVELPWDSAWTWWFTFLGVDFCYYWVHRFAHGTSTQPRNETRITNTCIFTGTFSRDSCLAGSSFAAHVCFLTCERVLWCDSERSVFRRSCFHWGTHLKSFQWETPDRSVGLKRKKWLWSARIRGV